jgi:threonine dehydrogenase-like Zn-dependent dehydrogenase
VEALVVNRAERGGIELVRDYPDPTPAPGEVTVRVGLAGICSTDLEIARGYMDFSGVPGHEFVGTVVGGSNTLQGKRVVAEINCACAACDMCRAGLSTHCRRRTVLGIAGRDGAFAQYLTLPERNCHVVPDGVADRQAVFVEPLAAAVQVVKQHPVSRDTRVAVIGIGRLGSLITQVLALQGCEVVAIDRGTDALEFARRRGIRAVRVDEVIPRADHELVVESTGSPDGLNLAMQLVRPRGTIVLKSTYAGAAEIDLAPIVIHEIRLVGNRCGPFPDALELLRTGKVEVEELVSGEYSLERGIEAFAAAADPRNVKILLRIRRVQRPDATVLRRARRPDATSPGPP